jgi:outer membrane scaffolding protein for murein synthesis (MipA/OmpV family)
MRQQAGTIHFMRSLAALAFAAVLPAAALAQTAEVEPGRIDGYVLSPTMSTQSAAPRRFATTTVTVRAGAIARPGYFGDDSSEIAPDFSVNVGYARIGDLDFGNPDPLYRPTGFGLRGSFRFIPERNSDEYDELAGLETVERTAEAGLGLSYSTGDFEVFADARYGFLGHETFIGEIGADAIGYVGDRWTLRAGPRVIVGTDDFADTYFGVSSQEASRSAFSQYDASGGLLSVGISLEADYQIGDRWGISAGLRVDELQGDAADSPISAEDTQFRARIGVTRRFTFGF